MKMPRLHSGTAIDRPETFKIPPIPEVVWQQLQETHSIDIYKNSTTNSKRKNDVKSKMSPKRETSSQVSLGPNHSWEKQTRSMPVQCPNDSKKQQPLIQPNETDMKTYHRRYDNIYPPKIITSQNEERLVRSVFTK